MMTLNIGDKELKIKFGYKPTLKERIVSRMVKLTKNSESNDDGAINAERMEDLFLFLPEILLVGMQVYHEDFRYNYDTKEGKEEKLNKVFDLIDEYSVGEDADLMKLFNELQDEMKTDSFLASLFREEERKAEEIEEIAEETQKIEN